MKQKMHYFLMVSCPSDTEKERALLQNCVDSINKDRDDDSWIEMRYWATDTASDAGMSAQDSINEQIVKESDGLIAIFNARLGTPVHSYRCGTEEEIELMLKAGKHVSLLFNTKPQLDLNKADCIDQITKLVNFKKEKSANAYYKEFINDEDFIRIAKQEIRLWLRKIISSHQDSKEAIEEPKEECTSLAIKPEESKLETECDSLTYDESAGAIDIVEYVTEAANKITNELRDYQSHTEQLAVDTNSFSDRLVFLQKQPNANRQILIACKQYSIKLNSHAELTSAVSSTFKKEWNLIFLYLRDVIKKFNIKEEDKQIIRESLIALQNNFEMFDKVIVETNAKLASSPNYQKDITGAIKHFNSSSADLSNCLRLAIDNCDEIVVNM